MNETSQSNDSFALPPIRRRQDPLLQELWDIKAKLNKDAGYDVERLYAQIQQEAAAHFDAQGRVRAVRV
jgi:hypothetical protein